MELFDCRLCGGSLKTVLDLGKLHVSGFLAGGEQAMIKPLILAKCENCEFVQLKHMIDPDKMYRKYWYKSSLNKSMLNSLKDVVECALQVMRDSGIEVKTVLDIGANDGSMLAMYPKEVNTIGFDPALNLREETLERCDYFVSDYFREDKYPAGDFGKADIITAIAMFYDLNDPERFLFDVSRVMSDNGIFIIQMADLVSMLMFNAFDNICHEHAGYYTVPQIVRLLNENKFIVFRVEHNQVNGGSIRVYAAKDGSVHKIDESVQHAIANDVLYLQSYNDPFAAFSMRVTSAALTVSKVIMDIIACGGKVYALGASTKGNTLLQYFGLNYPIIEAIGEVNEDKFGKRTVGTQIPIIPESELLKKVMPQDIVIILPWHFKPFFMHKLGNLSSGVERMMLLVPLPEPELVSITKNDIKATSLYTGEDIIGWARI